MPNSGVSCCLTVHSSWADALHFITTCGERSVTKWAQRSWQAGRRVTHAQQQEEMLGLKPHKTSVEPGQASYLPVSSVFIPLLFH